MRSLIAGPFVPAYAENSAPTPNADSQVSVFEATFKAFPSGGDPLSTRISDMITANPKLAAQLAIYMREHPQTLNRAQKLAAEH
jgi:hypothetical protein